MASSLFYASSLNRLSLFPFLAALYFARSASLWCLRDQEITRQGKQIKFIASGGDLLLTRRGYGGHPLKGRFHLPYRPLAGRMIGDIEMNNFSSVMAENYQDIQQTKMLGERCMIWE
jgi:hypothetical protein